VEAGSEHGIHCLSRLRKRHRLVEEESAGRRVGDDRALVTDDEVVKARLLEVGPHGAEHPAGDDDDVRTGAAGAAERLAGARPQHAVLGDQRPVEVERERGDARREAGRKLYGAVPPVDVTT
jgi:hypothetical protein